MAEVIWWFVCGSCGLIFLGIGIYAMRLQRPMWFWTGTSVDPSTITDVRSYNRENGWMWIGYSLPFWIAALLYTRFPLAAVILMTANATAGAFILIWRYQRISRKYERHV